MWATTFLPQLPVDNVWRMRGLGPGLSWGVLASEHTKRLAEVSEQKHPTQVSLCPPYSRFLHSPQMLLQPSPQLVTPPCDSEPVPRVPDLQGGLFIRVWVENEPGQGGVK